MAKGGRLTAALFAVLGLAACSADPTEGQIWGTGIGAATGSGIGRAVAIGTRYPWSNTGVGLLAGTAIGYAVGDQIDPPAQRMWAQATVAAAEAAVPGRPVTWESHGHHGSVTMVGAAWVDAGGRDCRHLHQEASRLGGETPPYAREVVACLCDGALWEVMAPMPQPES